MDEVMGKIIQRLDEKGFSDNTLIIFMSDNGGSKTGSNSPLNGYKGNLFEGGIRVPCAVKWPGIIPAGIISDLPCMTFDFSASVIRVAGANKTENRSFDGIDILKCIENNTTTEERALFWRARRGEQTRKAVRLGNLKYISLGNNNKVEEYLFDLENDLEEKDNLLNFRTDDVRRLKDLLSAWEVEVKPVR